MKIVISGFEPFGGMKKNPTTDLLKKAESLRLDGVEIETVLLPVVFSECAAPLLEKVAAYKPDAVLAFGVAAGRSAVNLERIGINAEDTSGSYGDNAGDRPAGRPVVKGGPDGIFSTLPLVTIVEELKKKGIPAEISNSAGTYICNTTLYTLLHYIKEHNLNTIAGFIHVPATPDMTVHKPGTPSMGMQELENAMEIIIKKVAEQDA